jgi:hypothetical protein
MVRSPTSTRRGTLALPMERTTEGFILNTGGAYGGEMHLTGPIRLRLSRAAGELVMLREHDRGRIVGAWTGARVDGRRVVATGMRWADTADAAEQRKLVEDGLLTAASIGFSGRWRYRDQLSPEELAALAAEGADLTRLVTVIDDVEVYEASLVAVGADAGARWSMDEGEDDGLSDAQRLMVAHLVAHHDMSEADALAEVVGPVLPADGEEAAAEEAAAEDAPAEDPPAATDDGALFDVPDAIREAAQQGLDWREEYGRGGTASGVRTARALVSGQVSPELLITIAAWWARFAEVEGPLEEDGEPTALAIARALWGGDDAQAWADGLVDDARAEVDGEMSAAAPAPVPGILHLLRPVPPAPAARSGITHLLRAPQL